MVDNITRKGVEMTFYLGDNLEVMSSMADRMVDLTVTSPPYDDMRTYEGTLKWDFSVFKAVADELYRITKDGGVVVWVVGDRTKDGNESGTSFRQALYFKEIGFRLFDTMIWKKKGGGAVGSNYSYWQSFEYMFVFSKGKPKSINLLKDKVNATAGNMGSRIGKRTVDGEHKINKNPTRVNEFGKRDNVWEIGVGNNTGDDKIAFQHPAIFPEDLANDHIVSWSKAGDIVFDPFMGSGTTAKMAYLTKRDYIGIEKVSDYYEIASKRLDAVFASELPEHLFGEEDE